MEQKGKEDHQPQYNVEVATEINKRIGGNLDDKVSLKSLYIHNDKVEDSSPWYGVLKSFNNPVLHGGVIRAITAVARDAVKSDIELDKVTVGYVRALGLDGLKAIFPRSQKMAEFLFTMFEREKTESSDE